MAPWHVNPPPISKVQITATGTLHALSLHDMQFIVGTVASIHVCWTIVVGGAELWVVYWQRWGGLAMYAFTPEWAPPIDKLWIFWNVHSFLCSQE